MRKLFGTIVAILLIGGIASSTNPGEEDFSKAFSEKIYETTRQELISIDSNRKEVTIDVDGIARKITGAANEILSYNVKIKDYKLFSVASVESKGNTRSLAIGLMGKIYVLGNNLADQIRPKLEPTFDKIMSADTELQPYLEDILKLQQ